MYCVSSASQVHCMPVRHMKINHCIKTDYTLNIWLRFKSIVCLPALWMWKGGCFKLWHCDAHIVTIHENMSSFLVCTVRWKDTVWHTLQNIWQMIMVSLWSCCDNEVSFHEKCLFCMLLLLKVHFWIFLHCFNAVHFCILHHLYSILGITVTNLDIIL